MNDLLKLQENSDCEDIFTKCFISLSNLSQDRFPNFECTVYNQPLKGNNIKNTWQFTFYADTPFLAMKKGLDFVMKNVESNFTMNYEECVKLKNMYHD